MSHLDTAYKLGAAQAVDHFTEWLAHGEDNPTQAPQHKFAAKLAVQKALKKMNPPAPDKKEPPVRARPPKRTQFEALKTKLRKKKNTMTKKSGLEQPDQPRARELLRQKLREGCPLQTAGKNDNQK